MNRTILYTVLLYGLLFWSYHIGYGPTVIMVETIKTHGMHMIFTAWLYALNLPENQPTLFIVVLPFLIAYMIITGNRD